MENKCSKIENDWVWKGPEIDGITQSILREFLVCRERARIKLALGLKPVEHFSPKLAYGRLFHACLDGMLNEEFKALCQSYPEFVEQLTFWKRIAQEQAKSYLEVYKNSKEPILASELVFDVKLDKFRLRGKVDGLIEKEKKLWVVERKTTSKFDESEIISRVSFDLQTGFYLVALTQEGMQIGGVYYDVVKRPLSGGKYSFRQRVNENPEEYFQRIVETFYTDPEYYFNRYAVVIIPEYIEKFKQKCLLPLLHEINIWYKARAKKHHWITPIGVTKRYRDSLDEYIESEGAVDIALEPFKLFSELEEEYGD